MTTDNKKNPTFALAVLPLIILVGLLGLNVYYFGDDALGGANQMALIFAAVIAGLAGSRLGFSWKDLENGMVKSIKSALPAILILLLIGALAGTWMISGIVPTMIFYGLKILNPTFFLFAACIISAVVAVATGSSWSTVATVGVALLGIGVALGIPEGMCAGAIISGAYFGDKMSPLSDTTNLAPAMAGTDLFTHIRYMAYTTIPSIVLTLIIFLVLGFTLDIKSTQQGVGELLTSIESSFVISPWLLLVPVVVILLIVRKVSAIPALLAGTVLAAIVAVVFQSEVIWELMPEAASYAEASYMSVINAMSTDVSVVTGNDTVDALMSTGGMYGMLNTIWLIVCAMCFGGIMEACGFLRVITQSIIRAAKSVGSLIATTAGTCIFFNLTASDQYLSIVVPGRMYADTYRDRGLAPENLSRTLEDSGTVTSVLIPWNTCGATQSNVLGVYTGDYFMYCFFNLISPVMTIIYGYFGIKIRKLANKEA